MAGIFKATDTLGYDIVIYSKWCIECIYSEFLLEINLWALHNNLDIKVVRTAYRPADHSKAMEYYSKRIDKPVSECADYPILFIYGDKILYLEEFLEMIRGDNNKVVTYEGSEDDVQGLSKTKRNRRKIRSTRSIPKDKKKD